MKINWNKIKLSPVAQEFICWCALLGADVLVNVFRNHGILWSIVVVTIGLVGFFIPDNSKKYYGYAFSALLICLPIGGILQNKQDLSNTNYLETVSRLESQKEVFNDSLYQTSNEKQNCEFKGKHANFYKRECLAGILAIEKKKSSLTAKGLEEKERIRVKNEGLDAEINKLPKSISWGEFFSDPKIFRGLVGSFLIPLLILAAFPRSKKESIELPTPNNVSDETSEIGLDDKVLVLLQKNPNKTDVARKLNIRRGKVYEIIAKYKKVSGEHFRTESDTDRTPAEHPSDIYRAKGERWGHEGQVNIKVWNTHNLGD